jgi:hypothetical protein
MTDETNVVTFVPKTPQISSADATGITPILQDQPDPAHESVSESKHGEVISLADRANNSMMSSPEQSLRDALSMVGQPGNRAFTKGKKLIVLCLDDTQEGHYDISFVNAGMSSSQIVALLETSKLMFARTLVDAQPEI